MLASFNTVETLAAFSKLTVAGDETNTTCKKYNIISKNFSNTTSNIPDILWGSIVFIKDEGLIYFNLKLYGDSNPYKHANTISLIGKFTSNNVYSSTTINPNLFNNNSLTILSILSINNDLYKKEYAILLCINYVSTRDLPDGSSALTPIAYVGMNQYGDRILIEKYTTIAYYWNLTELDGCNKYNILSASSSTSVYTPINVYPHPKPISLICQNLMGYFWWAHEIIYNIPNVLTGNDIIFNTINIKPAQDPINSERWDIALPIKLTIPGFDTINYNIISPLGVDGGSSDSAIGLYIPDYEATLYIGYLIIDESCYITLYSETITIVLLS